jgi:hypothetical protein
MSNSTLSPESNLDAFSRAVVARISESTDQLPRDVTERLRAARMQALAKRKVVTVAVANAVFVQNGVATLQSGNEEGGFWRKLASVIPLIALLTGLVSIGWIQDELRADELAKVDVELLLDELPPSAYTDPGFVQFLRKGQGN